MKSKMTFLLYNNISNQKTSLCACEHFIVSILFVSFTLRVFFRDRIGNTLYFFSFVFYFFLLFLLSQAKHLVSLFTSILQWVKHSTSFLLVWTFQAFWIYGSVPLKRCRHAVGLKKWGRMTLQNKINIFVFVFVHKENIHLIFWEKLNSSLKCTMVAEGAFIGATVKLSQLSKQTADWWNCWGGCW